MCNSMFHLLILFLSCIGTFEIDIRRHYLSYSFSYLWSYFLHIVVVFYQHNKYLYTSPILGGVILKLAYTFL